MSNPRKFSDQKTCTKNATGSVQETLYTRSADGLDPVVVTRSTTGVTYRLERPEGSSLYTSARQLLIAVTGHQEARHWPVDRYFRRGKYALDHRRDTTETFFDAFGPQGWAVETPKTRASFNRGTGRSDHLGVDLIKRGKEVAKLLYAGFYGMIRSNGYDPEEVLQEVYQGILVRNRGTCPFDPAKASFGHYVHMVCGCILSNYHRRIQRYRSGIQEGVAGWEDGELVLLDAGDDRVVPTGATVFHDDRDTTEDLALRDLARAGHHPLAEKIVPLIGMRADKDTIAETLGVPATTVTRACAQIRRGIREHQSAQG